MSTFQPKDETFDDVTGHKISNKGLPDDEATEGHKISNKGLADDEDTEGHKLWVRGAMPEEDDETEGHRQQ